MLLNKSVVIINDPLKRLSNVNVSIITSSFPQNVKGSFVIKAVNVNHYENGEKLT